MSDTADKVPHPSSEVSTTELLVEPLSMSEPPRRRKVWPWVLGGVVLFVFVLGLIAVLIGDGIVRGLVRDEIETRVTEAFALEPGTQVEVELSAAPVIPQLLAGRLEFVEVGIPEFVLGDLTGAVTLRAESVPVDANAAVGTLTGRFAVDESQLASIADQLSGIAPEQLALEEPEIIVSTTFELFGFEFPVGLGVEPGIQDGALIFTPTSVRIGEERLSAEQFTENPAFTFLAQQLLQQQAICLAELLPAEVALGDATVQGQQLVLTIAATDVVLADSGTRGSCGG